MANIPAWYYKSDRYHLDDDGGVPVIRYAPGGFVKWRGDCFFCEKYTSGESDFFPDHGERSWCRNGRPSTHCTCDSCF